MTLFHDYLFLIPLAVLLLSELAKLLVEGWKTGHWHQPLFRPGGMPSSHSAFVMSLLIVVWRKVGIDSTEFAIAFCFASIVWYDAMTTRRVLGEQGKLLNQLQSWEHFAERLGHSSAEVLVGMVFGAIVTAVGIWVRDSGFIAASF